MKNKTRYTCPFLMCVARWYYKIKLWRTHDVFWNTPPDGKPSYVLARLKGKSTGGFQMGCPFPNWTISAEMCIRHFFLVLSAWIQYPDKMYESYKKRR